MSDKANLDYETNTSHTVTLTATDSSDEPGNNSASITVTIYVTDLDERPEIMASTGGVTITGSRSVSLNEGSTSTGATYTAEGATPRLSGADAGEFTFRNGVLAFKSAPDYETKSTYRVTVTATDGEMTATPPRRYRDGHQRERGGGGDAVDNAAPGWNGDNSQPDRR